jgi:diguanylate cyclase (GGDEF)-like protein
MKTSGKNNLSSRLPEIFGSGNLFLPAVSVVSLAATFFVSVSSLTFETKFAVFLLIVAFYTVFCVTLYFMQKNRNRSPDSADETSETVFNVNVERNLLALEEASMFFGAALKPADMFRLVASRINEMIPFASAALFDFDEEKQVFKIIGASGENSRELANLETVSINGLAGKVFESREIEFDEYLLLEKTAVSADCLKNLNSAVAAPLILEGDNIFGVVALYGDKERKFDRKTHLLLEAIAERIAPLFTSSLAFEKSLSNALTDSLTNLPNERAFYLILENQIAESQRGRDQRPLTVLTVDIKNFDALNQKYGHATGDRILEFAAVNIKAQLRKMDFLSRSTGDEFLVVLPTASDAITLEIIDRIENAARTNAFAIDEKEKFYLELNFGAATFSKNGETAQKLLQNARREKQLAKSSLSGNVIKFPKELVN